MPPRVSILIINWNSGGLLRPCLASLLPSRHEVIVVDNASRDGSADFIPREFPEVRLLREATNHGFAGGVNIAARHASHEYLLLLNPDTEAIGSAVETLRAFLAERPRLGGAAGVLVDAAGNIQRGFTVRRFPTVASWATDLLLIDEVWPTNPVLSRYQAADVDFVAPVEVEQPAGACLMLRREAFDAVGGMDERFHPAWFEDVDICLRLRETDWPLFVVPEARFRHRGGISLTALGLEAFSLAFYRNLQRFTVKHRGPAGLAAIKVLIATGMLERMLISTLRGDVTAKTRYASVLSETLRTWNP